jgi:mannitol-specific phosphotransferase system IIBC component
MEEGRNIPLVIMLSAGSVISIACIVYKFTMLHTLILVLATLIVFYIIGLIVKKIIVSINHDAEDRAALLAQEEYEAKQRELAEKEEIDAKNLTTAETDENISWE